MTNPKDVLESIKWHEPAGDSSRCSSEKLDDPRAAAGDFPRDGSAGGSSRCSSEKLDDLGLCVAAPKENKHPPKNRVSDLTDAVYRARHLVRSAQQLAAETRESLTSVVAQAAAALADLTQLEHEIENALDWLDIGEDAE